MIFHQTEPTLGKIMEVISQKQKGIYLRFGDGDVFLASGINDSHQQANSTLRTEMAEAFSLNGPTVLKSLPLTCPQFNGWEPGMYDGNHEVPYEKCNSLLNRARPLWNGELTEVYSPIALHFASTHNLDLCIRFLKFLKGCNCSLLVGNRNIPVKIKNILFGEQCEFVPTPPSQSYSEIDRIEEECIRVLQGKEEYRIIITSMGCSGRVLQKRLWKRFDNIFLFDFGSLMDALCGWNTRYWIELNNFNSAKFLEQLLDPGT